MNLTRRNALKGSAAVAAAAISAGGVPAVVNAKTSTLLPAAVDERLVALADEMNRLDTARDDIDWRLGHIDGNTDPTLDEAGREALRAAQEAYGPQREVLEDQLIAMPARTLEGVLAKIRGWHGEDEQANMLAGGEPWDPLPECYVGSIYRDLVRLTGGASS